MRILLLSLYYPPLNTIAAQRIAAFEKYFSRAGIHCDVITRHYSEKQRKGGSMFLGMEESDDFTAPYYRTGNVIYTNFTRENKFQKTSSNLPRGLRGLYNLLHVDIYHSGWLDFAVKAYHKELSGNKYDLIISSYGPPVMLLAGNTFSNILGVPWIPDFRDSYITEEDPPTLRFIKKLTLRQVLKNAGGMAFATHGMKSYFKRNSFVSLPSAVVYNGLDEEPVSESVSPDIVEQFREIQRKYRITLLHTGTLYKGQNISFFANALSEMNAGQNNSVALVFLGLAENDWIDLGNDRNIFFIEKTSKGTAIELQKICSALVLPIWNGRYTGFSGKTMEYLGSGNLVLTSPDPQEDLLPFFKDSGNVIICNSREQLLSAILNISSGEVKKTPVKRPEIFQRAYWIEQFIVFLRSLLKSRPGDGIE